MFGRAMIDGGRRKWSCRQITGSLGISFVEKDSTKEIST